MSTIDDIEGAIQRLSREELATFRAWFAEFDAQAWDRQIEEDMAAGKLDALANEALSLDNPNLLTELDARFADCGSEIPWEKLRDSI